MNTVKVLLLIAANYDWPLYQLDVKNAFLQDSSIFVKKRKNGSVVVLVYVDDIIVTGDDTQGVKLNETSIEMNSKLTIEDGQPLKDIGRYQRLEGKLIYLTITRSDRTYVVSMASQFMHAPRTSHMEAIEQIIRYLKGSPGNRFWMHKNRQVDILGYCDADWVGNSSYRKSTTGFGTFVGGNIIT
ncbi:uncharacterized protein LOC110006833 [Amborella trichopoda]|uniref:uncharacterized protein LOC110006833 n=1 Tax=Amborella trichopoda TaxID=13333 RepID=UPI0009BFC838|nr:uncharacterized protein LOC110006833 [Amborella trichopoda]|eukprot:XP_020520075.1 uncharacterized protein LOC110006833 [Amborella trichopoda]